MKDLYFEVVSIGYWLGDKGVICDVLQPNYHYIERYKIYVYGRPLSESDNPLNKLLTCRNMSACLNCSIIDLVDVAFEIGFKNIISEDLDKVLNYVDANLPSMFENGTLVVVDCNIDYTSKDCVEILESLFEIVYESLRDDIRPISDLVVYVRLNNDGFEYAKNIADWGCDTFKFVDDIDEKAVVLYELYKYN